METTMPDWLSTLVTLLGGGVAFAAVVQSVARALPYIAAARLKFAEAAHTREQTQLVRAQKHKLEAEAKVTSEAATKAQLDKFYDELDRRLKDAVRRAEEAEIRAEKAEERAKNAEKRAEEIYGEYMAYRQGIGRDASITDPPPMPSDEEMSSARIEIVQRARGDQR